MKVERKLVLTNEEKTMIISLRDRLDYLLKYENEFAGRVEANTLCDALDNFCIEFFEDA